MRHARAGVVAACLVALAAFPVAAQQHLAWDNYCTVGAAALCSSIELDLTPDGDGTDVGIRMRNLEGTLGDTPWAMYNIMFTFELPNNPDPVSSVADLYPFVTMSGTADDIVTADPATCAIYPNGCRGSLWGGMPWEWRGLGDVPTAPGLLRSAIEDLHHTPIGIVGCDATDQPDDGVHWALGYFQTCGDGWVSVNFKLPDLVTFSDQSRVYVGSYDGAAWSSCEFGTTCLQVTATPEPSTLLLFGSGLAGLLGFRRRRRTRAV